MKKFKLNHSGVMDYSLVSLCEIVAKQMGERWNADNIRFDCRKINVAKNIYKMMEEAAVIEFGEQHGDESVRNQFAMMWCMSGPKAMDHLKDDEVEIKDGFVTYAEDDHNENH